MKTTKDINIMNKQAIPQNYKQKAAEAHPQESKLKHSNLFHQTGKKIVLNTHSWQEV